jgi:outer membrane immunogenic protein
MRRRLSCLAAALMASAALSAVMTAPAAAADYPVLRGTSAPSLPPPPLMPEPELAARWDGFYFGGLAGYTHADFNPGGALSNLARSALQGTTAETTYNMSTLMQAQPFGAKNYRYGAFLGYNWSFGDVVLGLEADYTRVQLGGRFTHPGVSRIYAVGAYQETTTLGGYSAADLNHLFSLRGRAGYTMGNLMFYATGGVAFGYGRTDSSLTVTQVQVDPTGVLPTVGPTTLTRSATARNAFFTGGTVGLGLEYMIGGLLLRGEYLYTKLGAQGGTTVDINQARLGAGVKF